MKFFTTLWKDIQKGENIDLYVTLAAAIFVAILNLFGISVFSIDPQGIILILLSILIFDALGRRHNLAQLQKDVNKPKKEIFFIELTNQQQSYLDERVRDCSDLLLIGNSLSRTLDQYYDVLEAKLKKGHKIRVVMGNPEGLAIDMTVTRKYRPVNTDVWRKQVRSALDELAHLKQNLAPEMTELLEIRTIDYNLSHGSIMIDLNKSDGLLFLWYHSFKTRKHSRPKYLLDKNDGYWYSYFTEEANAIWESSKPWNVDVL